MSIRLQTSLWKILVLLELINYQVVTIICNDFILFKFLRDIVLIFIVISFFMRNKVIARDKLSLTILSFVAILCLAVLNTTSINASFVFLRKYLSPVLLFYTLVYEKYLNEDFFINMLRYLLNTLSILGIWGIFQAHILGPQFLISLGYPTKYSYGYQAITLKDSFYFGNLGIQRAVSTLSNSNVFALILGVTIILTLINYKRVIHNVIDVIKFLIVLVTYLLTFSRANFLALGLVCIFCIWKYIEKKEYIFLGGMIGVCAFLTLYLYQDESGISHKLVGWVISSLTFKESSAAGRTDIWLEGLNAVLENPFGIGYGKVGSWAQTMGLEVFYHCENSYLAIALDSGWIGLFVFLIFLVIIIRKAYLFRNNDRYVYMSITALVFYMMIAFMFSNHIYDRDVTMIIFIMLGLMLNRIRREE